MEFVLLKLLVLDVDGTLTDGSITYGAGSLELKTFSVKDGLILKVLPEVGIHVVILTGRECEAVQRRGAELGIEVVQGIADKAAKLRDILAQRGIPCSEVAYIGDDLNDYAAMQLCGFKACPADAAAEICGLCDYVSPYNGGHGAIRDICEYIVKQSGKWGDVLRLFGG